MKTTVEIPDALFREAKAQAALQGLTLKEFFTDAIRLRLHTAGPPGGGDLEPAWKKAFGGLRHLHAETKRIERVIANEFERIDEDEWR